MRPLALAEILGLEAYEALRAEFRAAVIAHKRHRRLALGEKVTLVFEDRETLRFQVQEMLRVERIADPQKIQDELDVYNELLPGEGELSATLFVEITELPEIRPELDRLVGIDEHVALLLGDGSDCATIRARFDDQQMEEDRISAVQYIRFALDAESARRFADPDVPARIRIDHPAYRAEAELPPDTRRSLAVDLAGGPEPLLPAAAEPAGAPARDEVLFESGRVRAVRLARSPVPGHVVVEALDPETSLLDADAELLAELLAAVQRVARDVAATHGACRVQADAGGSARPLRWNVFAPGAMP